MEQPKEIPTEVILAIRKKFFPNTARSNDVIRDLKWDNLNGCYYFTYAGMYHGVETDGYIHT